jgi:hypothetical protein
LKEGHEISLLRVCEADSELPIVRIEDIGKRCCRNR